jgi:hypothetical protein
MKYITVLHTKDGKEYFHEGESESVDEKAYMMEIAVQLSEGYREFIEVSSSEHETYFIQSSEVVGFWSYFLETPTFNEEKEVLQ